MAPQGPVPGGWLSAGTLSLDPSFYCIAVLLIITIILLSLCNKCDKHTLQHQENSEKVQPPLQLIRVSPIGGATGGKDSLWHTNLTDQKGDPALTSVPENKSLQSATDQEGTLWYPPWRSHSGVPVYAEGELSANSNERLTLKTGGDISKEDAGKAASEGELTGLDQTSHMGVSRMHAARRSHLPPTPEDVTTGTKNLKCSLQQPQERKQHTSEIVQETCSRDHNPDVLGVAFPEDNSEDRDYQTIEELTCHSSQKNHVADRRYREDPVAISPTPLEGKAEDPNAMYARIIKKIITCKAPVQLPLKEEDESAPPVPDKCFDMEDCI
nr:uncharacterized protein LOC111857662 isoform X1 [Paramormyrops kingsleyae]XP_023694512.1 uncharacterized protein LOC111857662 isoform X1 [Paramormyrops kingsleyae]XP_023694513.1 uncharacterized protein LOC111857662 isoform X1 [Paramormyrops kingsleyae]